MTLTCIEQHKSFDGIQGVYQHQSDTVCGKMIFSIYIPPQAKNKKVPVLYYLSGLTCTQENVTSKSGIQKYAAELGLMIICPDTSPRDTNYPGEDDDYDFGAGAGFYLDATVKPWSATYNMYSYIVKELPDVIISNFPADKHHTGILGHSMGGHGALTIALKNPTQYISVSAFSPIVAPSQVPWGQKAFSGYLGDDKKKWQHYDATELINAGYKLDSTILIDQGTDDSFLKQQLRPELFEKACTQNGQNIELRFQQGYDHSYFFIATFIADHIRHHAEILTQP